MSSFSTVSASGIGVAFTTIYTATSNAIVIGFNISNTSKYIMPIDVVFNNGVDNYVKKDFRIENGASEEIMKGNKIVLNVGHSIKIKSAMDGSIDATLSLLTGV